MTILFPNSIPKIATYRQFFSKFRDFFFGPNITTREIRGCWFQLWQQYFQIPVSKYGNQAFLVPNLSIFTFCTKLGNKANSGALIENMSMAFQNCCPNHRNKAFSVPNLRILIFAQNFAIRQIGGLWLQIWQ